MSANKDYLQPPIKENLIQVWCGAKPGSDMSTALHSFPLFCAFVMQNGNQTKNGNT